MSLTLATGPELRADALMLLEPMRRTGFVVTLTPEAGGARGAPVTAVGKGDARLALVGSEGTTSLPPGVEWAAVPRRVEPRDVLVPAGAVSATLQNLAPGTRVGVAGTRRWSFLRAHRQDVEPVALVNGGGPGAALASGNVDAAILGATEARRSDLAWRPTELLDPKAWIPGPCQGAVILLARGDDEEARRAAACVEDAATRSALVAECGVTEALGVRPDAPLGVLALPHGRWIRIWGMAASPDGRAVVRGDVTGAIDNPEAAGRALADLLLTRGAGDLLSGSMR